jgi:hypothetical protein
VLAARQRPLVEIKEAPEALEDDDVLEMVNAGLVDVTVTDDYMVDGPLRTIAAELVWNPGPFCATWRSTRAEAERHLLLSNVT